MSTNTVAETVIIETTLGDAIQGLSQLLPDSMLPGWQLITEFPILGTLLIIMVGSYFLLMIWGINPIG
jgi:hypothetical protein